MVWPHTDAGREYIAMEAHYHALANPHEAPMSQMWMAAPILFVLCLIIGAVRTLRDKLRARRERLRLLEQIRQARAR